MTRPLAAGGFFVALVQPNKMTLLWNPFDLGKLDFSLLKPQVNRGTGVGGRHPPGWGSQKAPPRINPKTQGQNLAVKDGEVHRE